MSRKKKLMLSEAIDIAKSKFGEKYSYEDFDFTNMVTKSVIICKKHGNFSMTMWNHAILGQECPKCKGRNLDTSDVIKMFNEKHKCKYKYDKFVYSKMHSKAVITCKIHGDFMQTPSKHLLGQGCRKCKSIENGKSMTLSEQVIVERAKSVHGDKYSYKNFRYYGMHSQSIITCNTHGDFKQMVEDHLNGHGCPKCSFQISRAEDEIFHYVTKIVEDGMTVKSKDRNVLNGKEIDILIPQKEIGIEYNGDRWHSDMFKDIDYHINKKNLALYNGIDLILINEIEYKCHKDTILEILSFLINGNINDDLLDKMISVELITVNDDEIKIDNRYSTRSLLRYIEDKYNTSNFIVTNPTLVIKQNSNYKHWDCGFITYKL